ncbi:MAG: DNA methyltransferase, partial [Inconstantimicrobium porci]
MTDNEQREAARQFYYTWKDRGDEKSDSQLFWTSLLKDVLGMDKVEKRVIFEKRVIVDGQTKFIDVFIPESRVLIEQKSSNKKLSKGTIQSGGMELTPYQQAKRYADNLPFDEKPRWIVLSNFSEIRIHDMNTKEPEKKYKSILLYDIQSKYHMLKFLVQKEEKIIPEEVKISVEAGNIVGLIYDALLEQYEDKTNPESLKSLNKLCVRLVFCMYAEHSGLLDMHLMFHDYMSQFNTKEWRNALKDLFKVLNTKPENRDTYLEDDLAEFPYVNGGLFAEEDIEIPRFTDSIVKLILEKGCQFDWSEISPTIFGAVFESTLNPETRRSGGMHYTSIENIHKVIDPLFLDDLKAELEEIQKISILKQRNNKLIEYQKKLSSLTFLDPACGSGNFLTESYISLRKLENQAVLLQTGGQISFGEAINPIQVSIKQFYGIEINDFAVTVAKTALWIAEHQMMKQTEDIVHMQIDFLPLKSYANIVEGNALRIDWESIISKDELSYIMGNPPFIGMKEMTPSNKEDMALVIHLNKLKQMDYVASWYFKSAEFISGTKIHCAFVSSNSIVQGEQALTIWKPLFEKFGVCINFAYRTFQWDSEAKIKAHVHCVIIGFSLQENTRKLLFEGTIRKECDNINQYLAPAETIFIDKIGKPICNVEVMTKGAQLIDGGNFIIGGKKEYEEVLAKEPDIKPYIRRYFNARDLINGSDAVYALFLEKCPPHVLKKSSFINDRISKVYKYRAENKSPSTNILKDKPASYFQSQVPQGKSIVVPVVSSQNRRYIPICFMPENMVYTNALFFIDNATIYTFGVLMSNVHMAWMRTVCGRLKSDYRYSNTMVYNTFPWCKPSKEQKLRIEETAQGILNARALYPDSSLADLYDELTMPQELRKAHQQNDIAVMNAYGFSVKEMSESDCVAELMKMYQNL